MNHHQPLSVFFHPYIFWETKFGGIARYVVELGESLIHEGVDLHCPIKETPTQSLLNSSFYDQCSKETPNLPWYIKLMIPIIKRTKYAPCTQKLKRRAEGIQALKTGHYDIIHPSYHNSTEILKHCKNRALVITVHDMIHEIMPDAFSKSDPTAIRRKLMINRADRIIAISEQTKADILQFYPISADKIDVIYHGNSLTLPQDVNERKLDIPSQYLLFVGHRFAYKNFICFAEEAARLMAENPDLHIICAGGREFYEQERKELTALGILDKTHQMSIDDETLAILYNRSIACVYPSLYEGFGLPILEAFSCKTPIICAKASCLPEIGAEACLYFDPHVENSLYEQMKRITESEDLRQEYIARGTERLKFFSWEKCAKQTLECYRKAIEHKKSTK